MAGLDRAASIEDLRRLARRRLPRAVFDFIDGGAGDERTLRENRRAFDAWHLMPRVGVDVTPPRSLAARIVGVEARLPLVLAPIGLAGLFAPEGEVTAARAAAAAGIPFCLSTNSVASIEEVAAGAPAGGDRWFQLYMLKDRGLMAAMLERAAGAGYRTLCVTVDLPVQGRRERDLRNAFSVPLRPRPGTILDLARRPRWLLGILRSPARFGNFAAATPSQGFTSVAQHVATLFDPSAGWDEIARLRERWPGPVVVKGVLHPDDARRAVDAVGASAVIVSNHGGRQLDQVPAAVAALPRVTEAVDGRAEVILDGGVRRGTDILKARALGASACMIGRAFVWGLAAGGGQAGVARSLDILREELDNALALLGRRSLADVDRRAIVEASPSAPAAPGGACSERQERTLCRRC
jgi:isopentenyl diphosphate isomerase/L-lactate dehydrogenase-like FMN-dependent dehydrogenase